MFRKRFILILVAFLLILGGLFYFRQQVYYSHGEEKNIVTFEIVKGEGNTEISSKLKEKKIISGQLYFYYYLRSHNLLNKIMPGDYLLTGTMTIPEVAHIITNPEEQAAKITFPEGLTARDMAEVLRKNNFDGDAFLQIVNNPTDFKLKYAFLNDPKITTLEGYLFPDTYFFRHDATAENIVAKMLDDFDTRVDDKMLADIQNQNHTLQEMITMASIVEKEVPTSADMKIVSGLFWNRLGDNMSLQSDATLSYILNDNVDQHSLEQLKTNSPYNTYKNKGLPPAPIANPGLAAIMASIYPEKTDYTYFLTVGKGADKKTIFSKTFEEHVSNRAKYGI